jgi:phosphatidylinositol glycan class K
MPYSYSRSALYFDIVLSALQIQHVQCSNVDHAGVAIIIYIYTMAMIQQTYILSRRISKMLLLAWILPAVVVAFSSSSSSMPLQNTHAVLVSSSRYWFNYRHAVNVLAIYQILKENGIPDSHITVMLADEHATNARNAYKNGMYASGVTGKSLYNASAEIDYRGADVTVQTFLNVLLGIETPSSPRVLETDAESNVLIYLTGHGGDLFFKFQDEEELTAQDIANLLDEMHIRQRYKRVLFLADTCQAFTLADKIKAPNVVALGSSLRGENAYAHHSDQDLGLSVIERWTYGMTEYYYKKATAKSTLKEILVDPFEGANNKQKAMNSGRSLGANIGVREDLSDRDLSQILMSDFFGKRNNHLGSPKTNQRPFLKNWENRIVVDREKTIRPPPLALSSKLDESTSTTTLLNNETSSRVVLEEDATWEPSTPLFLMLVVLLGLVVIVSSKFL